MSVVDNIAEKNLHSNHRNIKFLLNKYKTKQPGEILKSENLKKEFSNKKWNVFQKKRTADIIMDSLNLKGSQRERVYYIIEKVDFNQICRNCSYETIITAVSYYVKKSDNTKIKLGDYKICKIHNLTEKKLSIIMIRLCACIQKNSMWIGQN